MNVGGWMMVGAGALFVVAFVVHLTFEGGQRVYWPEFSPSGALFAVALLLLIAGGLVSAAEGNTPTSKSSGDELERYGGR